MGPWLEQRLGARQDRRHHDPLDAYHCSIHGSTNPNRNFLWTGTTGYEPGSTARAVTNAAYSYDHAGYDWVTYSRRLQAAGVSWRIYQEWDSFLPGQATSSRNSSHLS